MGLASTVLLGVVGAAVMYVGARQILAGSLTLGGFFTYTLLLGLPGRAHVPGGRRSAPSSRRRSPAWSARARCCARRPKTPTRAARSRARPHRGRRARSRTCSFAYETDKAGAERRLLPGRAGHRHRARGPVGRGQVHDHRPARRVPHARRAARCTSTASTSRPCGSTATARSSASCCRRRSCSTAPSARTSPSRGPDATEEQVLAACRLARVDEFAETFPDGLRHRSWASAASSSPAGSASASRSRARCWPTRAS